MKYICYEGVEGVGKTTQVNKMVNYLQSIGKKVLLTKEPGTSLIPISLTLRSLILDAKYDKSDGYIELINEINKTKTTLSKKGNEYLNHAEFLIRTHKRHTIESRELIIQTVRLIHLEYLSNQKDFDYVIQDRGILSGLAYGVSNNVDYEFMKSLNNEIVDMYFKGKDQYSLYDQIIILDGNVSTGLKRAKTAKQEFKDGDVMENKGETFLEKVKLNFEKESKNFKNVLKVNVDGKDIESVFLEIKKWLV